MRFRPILLAISLFLYGCIERISPEIGDPDSPVEASSKAISKVLRSDHPPDMKQVPKALNQKTVNVFDSSSPEQPEDAIILSVDSNTISLPTPST